MLGAAGGRLPPPTTLLRGEGGKGWRRRRRKRGLWRVLNQKRLPGLRNPLGRRQRVWGERGWQQHIPALFVSLFWPARIPRERSPGSLHQKGFIRKKTFMRVLLKAFRKSTSVTAPGSTSPAHSAVLSRAPERIRESRGRFAEPGWLFPRVRCSHVRVRSVL